MFINVKQCGLVFILTGLQEGGESNSSSSTSGTPIHKYLQGFQSVTVLYSVQV